MYSKISAYLYRPNNNIAQSAGAVDYTDCTSAEGWDPPTNECPGYNTKQSDLMF